MDPTLFDLPAGARAAESGMALAGGAERVREWGAEATEVLWDLAQAGREFTADDVIAVAGLPSAGQNQNNAVGALFSGAARRGWIVRTGYRRSRRVLGHARALAVWIGNPEYEGGP